MKRNELVRRTDEQLLGDMAIVLNHPDLSYGTKFFALNNAIWVWTERFGKFEGCRQRERPGCSYWSAAALDLVAHLNTRDAISKALRHEHIVPRIKLVDRMLGTTADQTRWSAAELRDLFAQYCIGVVVTKGEDDKLNKKWQKEMPPSWDWQACAWARYADLKIAVLEATVTWSRGQFLVERRAEISYQWEALLT